MPTAANSEAFSQPHWRVIAAGFDTERWFSDDVGAGTGGIVNPMPTRLPSGHYYYRFASSSATRESQLGGGWWLDFENFSAVRRFAEGQGYRLKDAARLTLALPYDWTRVDLLVRALLREPLRAYTGLGKPAQAGGRALADRGTRWIPTQHDGVRQLYIPGLYVRPDQRLVELGRPRPRDQLFQRVFQQPVEISALR